MIGVTPFGILTENPKASYDFYHNVLGIERIYGYAINGKAGALLRLESTQIDVFSTETRLLDRKENAVVDVTHHLRITPRDPQILIESLGEAGIELSYRQGTMAYFEDLNGIKWEISGLRMLYPEAA